MAPKTKSKGRTDSHKEYDFGPELSRLEHGPKFSSRASKKSASRGKKKRPSGR